MPPDFMCASAAGSSALEELNMMVKGWPVVEKQELSEQDRIYKPFKRHLGIEPDRAQL